MDLSAFEKDNRVNCKIQGVVPEITKKEPCCLGIDEAGRGPVLDSKTLTEEKRESIFEKINAATDKLGWIVHVLSPNYISNSMLRRSKYNLNALSHDSAIGLIQMALDLGVNLTEVYVDTVGSAEKYQEKLKQIFPSLDITVASKADATYPIVGAASICAKVCRDRATKGWQFLEQLNFAEDYNYGSGYPGDEKTKKFMSDSLDSIFGFPSFVRFSWSTASNILDEKAVPVYWSDDESDDDSSKKAPKGVPAITSFFSSGKSETSVPKRHYYFTDRCLEQVESF